MIISVDALLIQALLRKYRSKGMVLDANLLVLLFVGLADPCLIRDFKRTRNQGFTENEFLILESIISGFSRLVCTPHILTETSNFIFQLPDQNLQRALEIAADRIQAFKERRPEAKNLVRSGGFFSFGLTDSAILDLPPKKYLVLSVDAALVIALNKKGVDAVNFNHLRQLSWHGVL
jgi:hypothetical protein